MIDPTAFLPTEPASMSSSFNGVRLNTRIIPALGAADGGDWCDAFIVSPDVIALSIGDVCGHGGEKSHAMAGVRQSIRDAGRAELDPAQALARVNRFLRATHPDDYATAIVAFFDSRRGSLAFANAGHPPPLMATRSGTRFLEYSDADLPLGIEQELLPAVHVVSVPATTLLVFYTDGVSEIARKPLQGAALLRDAADFAFQISALLAANVIEKKLCLVGTNRDDAALMTAWTPSARSCNTRAWTSSRAIDASSRSADFAFSEQRASHAP